MFKKIVFVCLIANILLSACGGPLEGTITPVAKEITKEPIKVPILISTQTEVPTRIPPTEMPTSTATPVKPQATPTPQVNYRIHGINIGPYLFDDPNLGATVSEDDLRSLIEKVAPYTTSVRTFGCGNGLDKAPEIAHSFGLTIAAGIWLGKDKDANEKELACMINLANNGMLYHDDLVIVGNETLLRADLTEQELISYINRFKEAVPGVPVASAESWKNISKYKDLIKTVDVVAVNAYPYLDNTKIDKATNAVEDWYLKFHDLVNEINPSYGYTGPNGDLITVGKEIIFTETGWPSCGKNGGNPEEAFYFASFTSFARALNLKFYWFEAYDEKWKTKYEGQAGGCWGLWDNQGKRKDGFDVTFSGIVGGEGTPILEFSDPPEIGNWTSIRGMAWHSIPNDYRVAVYVFDPENNLWWLGGEAPLIEIAVSGYWETDFMVRGEMVHATKVAAFLIPWEYIPPFGEGMKELPKDLYDNSIANTIKIKD
jgi:glucan 1,3-beta-glucosidase